MTAEDLIRQIEAAGQAFSASLADLTDEQEIRAEKARVLGKKGSLAGVMKGLGALPPGDRPRVGEALNRVKDGIEGDVARRLEALADAALAADLGRRVDVTLPGRSPRAGHLHLLTQLRREIEQIFAELGFRIASGPQIESDFHNFEALNMPKDHPARDMQDTFFLAEGDGDVLLRTHTSPVQIRTMLSGPPPVKIIAPGVVYRRDDDPTHSPMFSQVEGLLVDRNVSFAELKGTLLYFVQRFFGPEIGLRFRPSFFPFTEPSAEMDIECLFCVKQAQKGCRLCKHTGYIEVGGAGMVDPAVFAAVGYDKHDVTGFAFGFGIERMGMLRHGVDDIKLWYEGDARLLGQF